MNPNSRIRNLLQKMVLILDGAVGTELHKRGLPSGVCPEAWCLAHPEAVGEIHAAYREAGADIVYTSTFGANRLKMGQYGLTNVRETNRSLAGIAVRVVLERELAVVLLDRFRVRGPGHIQHFIIIAFGHDSFGIAQRATHNGQRFNLAFSLCVARCALREF